MKRVLHWIVPSAVAACLGGLVAGAIQGAGALLTPTHVAGMGLVAMLAIPALFVSSLAIRGIVRAWAPRELAASWREDRGGMPRFAAWTGVVWLGALALCWAMFQGTWLLVSWTAFKPGSITLLEPMLAVLALVVIAALSKPAADLFTIVARFLDRQWRRFAPGTLLSVPVILTGAVLTAAGLGALLWFLLIRRRLPAAAVPLDGMLAVLAMIAVTIAAHVAWRGPRLVRAIAGGLVGAATAAVIVAAVLVVRSEPEIAIKLWVEDPVARVALDRFDIERIRRELPLDGLRPQAARGAKHPDVVLVMLAGVRAEATPPYGADTAMPALRDLGERGAVFESAYTTSPRAGAAIPSAIVGVSPNRLRGRVVDTVQHLDPRLVTVTERMRAADYETAVFACCDEWRDRATGWTRGFQHIAIDDDPARLAYAAREWVKARTSKAPLFLTVHLSATGPDRLKRYDAAFADLVSAFAARTTEAAPIVILTADHGDDASDELAHAQLHVPLLVAGPSVKPQRITETVSLVDLMPTIVQLAGFGAPHGTTVDGRSVADVAFGARSGTSLSGVAFAWLPEEGDHAGAAALVRGNWKLIDSGGAAELYDLKTDPEEKTNLSATRMQQLTELRVLLDMRTRATKQSPFFQSWDK